MRTKTGETVGREVPPAHDERQRWRRRVSDYVRSRRLVPPLAMDELSAHACAIGTGDPHASAYHDYLTVLMGNEVWRSTVASIPYERRILLLPQCLRHPTDCPADMDELGLMCHECGRCAIGELQREAEGLGYVVLVAEGTTVVTRLLESGKVDAVVGVSCLHSLEKSFPFMAADAIPGVALPLLGDGCSGTEVDREWALECIRLRDVDGAAFRLDLDTLRATVQTWFHEDYLAPLLKSNATRTEGISLDWLAQEGKRWRPFLVAAVFSALSGTQAFPESLRHLAVAVECFHKASLIHDDIEDGDSERYGLSTLHIRYGVPVAINVGDLLLGEGYRLIAEAGYTPEVALRMLACVASAHRDLSLGQGEELLLESPSAPATPETIIDIFRRKTAPAFRVALELGALAAGASDPVMGVLSDYSESLGIAYQVRDDLDDQEDDRAGAGVARQHASLVGALDREAGQGAEKARQLLEHYRNQAIRSLNPLDSSQLKVLLRRVISKILS